MEWRAGVRGYKVLHFPGGSRKPSFGQRRCPVRARHTGIRNTRGPGPFLKAERCGAPRSCSQSCQVPQIVFQRHLTGDVLRPGEERKSEKKKQFDENQWHGAVVTRGAASDWRAIFDSRNGCCGRRHVNVVDLQASLHPQHVDDAFHSGGRIGLLATEAISFAE